MARKLSVILTPTEKKAAVSTAKDAALAAKKALADLNKARKADVDIRNGIVKEQIKAQAVATKAFDSLLKEHDKKIAAAQKAALIAEQSLNALSPPKAVPSPTDPV